MAREKKPSEEMSRGRVNTQIIDPNKIRVEWDMRGRLDPPSREKVEVLKASFREHGQQAAVECTRDDDNTPVLVMGYTRYTAAMELEAEEPGQWGLVVRFAPTKLNKYQRFLRAIIENQVRNDLKPMDEAHNVFILRTVHNQTIPEIAKQLSVSTAWVMEKTDLWTLPEDLKTHVRSGNISVHDALRLGQREDTKDPEVRESVVQHALQISEAKNPQPAAEDAAPWEEPASKTDAGEGTDAETNPDNSEDEAPSSSEESRPEAPPSTKTKPKTRKARAKATKAAIDQSLEAHG
jgi:ParB-like chromosome segregation protein Spo0J